MTFGRPPYVERAIHLNEDISSWNWVCTKVIKNGLTCHCDFEVQLDFLKYTRKALVQLLSSYGIILTLLASITFVAVLQPPGSFDPDGFVRSSKLVAAFMFFATSSFLLACTGLLTVAVGSAMMLRPRFIEHVGFEVIRVPPHAHHQIGLDGNLHPDQPNHSYELYPVTSDDVTYDNLPVMGKIILDNLYRTRRLRIYMGLSLLSCVTTFLCAGFAVTKSSSSGFYSLVAAIGLGGFPFLLEIVKMFMGPTFPRRKFCCLHDRLSQLTLEKTVSTKLQAISQRHWVLLNA